MQLISLIVIRWIVTYPVDSAIQRLNNQGQKVMGSTLIGSARFVSTEPLVSLTEKSSFLPLFLLF